MDSAKQYTASDLLNSITGMQDEQLVKDTFWKEDAKIILSIPLFEDMEEYVAWHPGPKGLFSVKSAYALGIRIRDQTAGPNASTSCAATCSFDWKKIWKMNVANKVKVFVWQFAHNSLPIKRNICKARSQVGHPLSYVPQIR